jgi:uncharacterized protein
LYLFCPYSKLTNHIIEAKFYNIPLVITKSIGLNIADKVEAFRRKSKTKKAIFVTLITAMGTIKNEHYHSWISNELDVSQIMR